MTRNVALLLVLWVVAIVLVWTCPPMSSWRALFGLSSASCWIDPRPNEKLDFDFYTGVDDRPHRCGYPHLVDFDQPDRSASWEMDPRLGRPDVIRCYPLDRLECPP